MNAHYITPVVGQVYANRNGGEFQCIGDTSYFDSLGNLKMIVPQEHCGLFERVSDGWRLFAHGVLQYEDGTVEWNYSTNGHYAN